MNHTRERPPLQLAGHRSIHVVRGFNRSDQSCQYVIYLCGQRTSFGVLGQIASWKLLESEGPVDCMNCLRMLAGRKPFEVVQV